MATLGTKLATRLGIVIEASGYTPTRLSLDMRKARNWLTRKLGDGEESRGLTVADCEEVLAFLEVPDHLLLTPLMLDGDLQVLRYLAAQGGWIGSTTVGGIFQRAPAALKRLLGQGLIDASAGEVRATPHGRLVADEKVPHLQLTQNPTTR